VLLGLGCPVEAWAQAQSERGLAGLRRVAVEVVLAPDHPGVVSDDLEQRMEEAIQTSAPDLRLDPRSPDVLRLVVSVRPYSANDLRGYYLPLSGSYGLGTVRLVVERLVTVPGQPGLLPAVVWQAERLARAPWARSGAEVRALAGEVIEAFLEDYRRALGR
jgi:hypothetical protein